MLAFRPRLCFSSGSYAASGRFIIAPRHPPPLLHVSFQLFSVTPPPPPPPRGTLRRGRRWGAPTRGGGAGGRRACLPAGGRRCQPGPALGRRPPEPCGTSGTRPSPGARVLRCPAGVLPHIHIMGQAPSVENPTTKRGRGSSDHTCCFFFLSLSCFFGVRALSLRRNYTRLWCLLPQAQQHVRGARGGAPLAARDAHAAHAGAAAHDRRGPGKPMLRQQLTADAALFFVPQQDSLSLQTRPQPLV